MNKPLQDITVLVADDVPLNLMIMSHLLTKVGATILTAANGRQVLEILEELPVDIVLMDLQMPVLDGYEATTVIRNCGQQYYNIPVLAVTAESEPAEIQKCMNVGMNDVITKPFEPQVIYQKILSLLQTQSAAQTDKPVEQEDEHLPSYDLSYLKEITNGQADKLMIIIDNLVENAPLLLQQSLNAVRFRRWVDAASHLHKLKGLAGLFFMPQISKALQMAEEGAKATVPSHVAIIEQIDFLSLQLPVLINQILNDMDEYEKKSCCNIF